MTIIIKRNQAFRNDRKTLIGSAMCIEQSDGSSLMPLSNRLPAKHSI